MLSFKEKSFVFIYFSVLICDLIISSAELQFFRFFSKPSILVALIVFFLSNKKKVRNGMFKLTILALLFSLLGDILLLFTEVSSLFFIGGLTSFLLAHVMYILVFSKDIYLQRKKAIRFALITFVYGCLLYYVLYEGLSDMKVPVLVYMIAILLMSNLAYLRSEKVGLRSYFLVFVGALLFMISDSILALNMFCKPIVYSNIWIMTTYALAQVLIVYGILAQKKG